VQLPSRISAVTLACRDIGRMAAFYRQFGWPEAPTSVPEHVVFQCANGVVLGLFGEAIYERQFGRPAVGFRGVAITIHCASAEEVVELHALVAGYDDLSDLDAEPSRSGWGSGFSFRDPEGNLWDVAWKAGAAFDEHGGFHYP
jgi:catechol 2,3-dioxygenase-like lactoylglutathione lyase family enzyme